MRQPATHVIFDLDGTLIDTEHIYGRACHEIASMFDRPYTDELGTALIGLSQREATPFLLEKSGLNGDLTVNGFNKLLGKIMSPLLNEVTLMPGAIELIRHLALHHIPMAICTSSIKKECVLKLKNLKEITELIPIVVTGDDPEISRGKPAPDPYLVTMRRFMQPPRCASDVVVFEDSLAGARAARTAGARVTMVYDERYIIPPKDIDVDYLVSSFRMLDLALLGLPPLLKN